MRNTFHLPIKISRHLLAILGFMAVVQIASSASYTTGGGKKKENSGSSFSSLSLKNSAITFNKGYHYKGGFSFYKNSMSGVSLNINSVYFQKGNNIYVIPHKQKVFFSKFKTPQKELK
jgi:hypothetical protein